MVLSKGVLKFLHTAKATLISACCHRIKQQRYQINVIYTHAIELGVISHPGFVIKMLSANKNILLFPQF